MLATQFLEAYPRTLPDAQITGDVGGVNMSEARGWSHTMGTVLHDIISGQPMELSDLQRMSRQYIDWNAARMHATQIEGSQLSDHEKGALITTELNFHRLNYAMFDLWDLARLRKGSGFRQERKIAINSAQDEVALMGLYLYAQREKVATKTGRYSYFDSSNNIRRQTFEGIANEFDAGLVLMELMKRDDELFVLPAPMQFGMLSQREDRKEQYSNNANFIALRGDEAVGIQVSSSIHKKDVSKYNPDRIVLLDARVDFGNERNLRTQQESTRQRAVTWGGLLCTQRVLDIRVHRSTNPLVRFERQEVLQAKFMAKQLVGAMHTNLASAVDITQERLMTALEAAA